MGAKALLALPDRITHNPYRRKKKENREWAYYLLTRLRRGKAVVTFIAQKLWSVVPSGK